MNRKITGSIITALLAAVAGCGGGGGSSSSTSRGTGNAAIDAAFASFPAAFNASLGTATGDMDPTLFVTSTAVVNPLNQGISTTTTGTATLDPGTNANDGTANVTVTTTKVFTVNADSSQTTTQTIIDDANAFTYLSATLTESPFTLSVRPMPFGFNRLLANGTGQAFVIVRASTTIQASRTFHNTNTNGSELVTFGALAAPVTPTTTLTETVFVDFPLEYTISLVSGALVAKIANTAIDVSNGDGVGLVTRAGGPATFNIIQTFTSGSVDGRASIDGVPFTSSNGDTVIPVGSDALLSGSTATPVPSNAAVVFSLTIGGGVTGTVPSTDSGGDLSPVISGSALTSISYSGAIAGIANVNDGHVDLDTITIRTSETETQPALDHILGGLRDVLYPQAQASTRKALYLLH